MTIPVSLKTLCIFAVAMSGGCAVTWASGGEVALAVSDLPVAVRVAGVSPSMAEVVDDVRRSPASGRLVLSSRTELAAALEKAVAGRTRPLLVVADAGKIRVMELRQTEK